MLTYGEQKEKYKFMSKEALRQHLRENGFLWGPEDNPYGVNGFMSYGPQGKGLKSAMETQFKTILKREGFDEIETPILYPAATFEASGHKSRFSAEMFTTQTSDGQSMMARPELATTIYPLFKKLLAYYGNKLPFRVSQMGIAMPNDHQTEWQLRTRQYTAHEGHIFLETNQVDVETVVASLHDLSFQLMRSVGLSYNGLEFREKLDKDKPFYATRAFGLYTKDVNDPLELLGIQYRGSRDFQVHSEMTKKNLKVNGAYPEVFEISFSTDRPFLVLIEQALTNTQDRLVLRLPEKLAPQSSGIVKTSSSPEMDRPVAELQEIFKTLDIDLRVLSSGDVGKGYRLGDARGIPYIFTFDKQTSRDQSFTLRKRDTREQVRVSQNDLKNVFSHSGFGSHITESLSKVFDLGKTRGVENST